MEKSLRQFHIQIRRMTNDPFTTEIHCDGCCGRNDQRGGKTALYRPAQPDFRNQGTGNELGITIFKRTNKGILLSAEGEEFLGYARQVIEQNKSD